MVWSYEKEKEVEVKEKGKKERSGVCFDADKAAKK